MVFPLISRPAFLLQMFVFFPLFSIAQRSTADSLKSMSYIRNEVIKVGIDLNLGGSITFVGAADQGENLINNHDWGRQVQMSFYGRPNPFTPNGKQPLPFWRNLGWNPIQSGDYAGNRSKVVAHKNDGESLYVKCIPMQWPLDNEPGECFFESWITLKGNTIEVTSRLVNRRADTSQYRGGGQELPAIYTNAPYHRIVTYRGEKPFTGDTVSLIRNHNFPTGKGIHWADWHATEGWAATLNDQDYGLGVWHPTSQDFKGGFYGDSTFKGGSKDASTAYLSPLHTEILDHNITYTYQYVLIVGTLKTIREYAYQQQPRQMKPLFTFEKDRQHWILENTTDSGWPLKDAWTIKLGANAAAVGPHLFWNASDFPAISLQAAWSVPVKKGRIYLRRFGERDFSEQEYYDFEVRPGDEFQTCRIDLTASNRYQGAYSGVKIVWSATAPEEDGTVTVKNISWEPSGK